MVPDAARGRCFLDPWLPGWLPRLEVDRVSVGGQSLRIVLAREGDVTVIEDVDADGIEVVASSTEAALWGGVST